MTRSKQDEVAESIFDVIWPTQEWDGSEAACRAVASAAARAAIEAMREPTEAMAIAGGGEPYLATSEQPLVFAEIREVIAVENIWQAMIDAALEDKP